VENEKPNNTQVSGVRFPGQRHRSMVPSDASESQLGEAHGPAATGSQRCRDGGPAIHSPVRRLSFARSVLPTVHSGQVPSQLPFTLEGGRPRSRAEKKIRRQRRFSFRRTPLTSDPDSPSCNHSISSGTRSEGEPSRGPHREKETGNAQHTEQMDRAQARRQGL
jgi:hypothetical protein